MVSAWDLIKEHRFEDARVAADAEYARSGSLLPLRNKVLALLCLREYDKAAALSTAIIDRDSQTDSDYIFLGVSQWLRGQHDAAVASWHAALRTKYADAAGGVEAPLFLYMWRFVWTQGS